MAYDEGLASRIRRLVRGKPGVSERKMFGGLAFLRDGHMFAGILGDDLMARVGPTAHAESLARPGARPMDFTGKPMKGYVFVAPEGIRAEPDLAEWIEHCLAFVATLPPKEKS